MVDLATVPAARRGSRGKRNEAGDSTILLIAAAGLLALLFAIAVMPLSYVKAGADYIPTMFGF